MNVMCYKIEIGLMETMGVKLIPLGFKLIPAENGFTAKKVMYTKRIETVIADISVEKKKENDMNFIRWISSIDQKNEIKKIILSNITDENNIRKLMEMGISSFISKKNSTNIIIGKLIDSLNKIAGSKRKHVRVTPDEKENPTVSFVSHRDNINGKIVNISMGGALVQINDPATIIGVSQNQEIKRLQMSINNKKIILDAVVVVKKKGLLGLKFTEISELYKETLSKYIFDKMSNS